MLQRRGLRNREWAVEWDDSAIDFLLDKGFTPDLGARPLQRAIEQHLLAPLATTIVSHEVPAGDQFLFVRAEDGAIQVRFVDPDAPDAEPAAAPPRRRPPSRTRAAPTSTCATLVLRRARHARPSSRCCAAGSKRSRRASPARPGRRASPRSTRPCAPTASGARRAASRCSAGPRTSTACAPRWPPARSLCDRLTGAQARERLPLEIVRAFAQQIYLLESAARRRSRPARRGRRSSRCARSPTATSSAAEAFAAPARAHVRSAGRAAAA